MFLSRSIKYADILFRNFSIPSISIIYLCNNDKRFHILQGGVSKIMSKVHTDFLGFLEMKKLPRYT